MPPVLRRHAPSQLSFAGNLFTTFPFEATTILGLIYLNLDSNLIATLHPELDSNGTVGDLYLLNFTMSSLPRWIGPLLERTKGYQLLHLHTRRSVTVSTRRKHLRWIPTVRIAIGRQLGRHETINRRVKRLVCRLTRRLSTRAGRLVTDVMLSLVDSFHPDALRAMNAYLLTLFHSILVLSSRVRLATGNTSTTSKPWASLVVCSCLFTPTKTCATCTFMRTIGARHFALTLN